MAFGSGPFGAGPFGGGTGGGPPPPPPPPSSTTSDQSFLKEMQYLLLENGNADADGATLLTSQFTFQEMVDALNERQQRFLRDTGQIVRRLLPPINASVNGNKYDLPADCIVVRRMAWQDGKGQICSLARTDTWEQDHGFINWPTASGKPFSYWETTLPHLRVGISPAPSDVGKIHVLYVALAQALTGAGVMLAVQDDWTPYVMWGALANLLSADGEAFDPVRADYCDRRYQEGVELARVVLMGDLQ